MFIKLASSYSWSQMQLLFCKNYNSHSTVSSMTSVQYLLLGKCLCLWTRWPFFCSFFIFIIFTFHFLCLFLYFQRITLTQSWPYNKEKCPWTEFTSRPNKRTRFCSEPSCTSNSSGRCCWSWPYTSSSYGLTGWKAISLRAILWTYSSKKTIKRTLEISNSHTWKDLCPPSNGPEKYFTTRSSSQC